MVRRAGVRSISAFAVTSYLSLSFLGAAHAACWTGSEPQVAPGCGDITGRLSDDLTTQRANTRIGGQRWIAETWQSAPFMIKQSAPAYTVRTSLAHLFTYDAHRRIAHGGLIQQGLTPQEVAALVHSVAPKAPVDLWTALDFDRDMDEGLVRGGFGADVMLGRGSVAGLAFERGDLSNGDDERVITYFKRRIATGLTWRMQGGWGTGLVESEETTSSVQNGYLNAGLQKTWLIDGMALSPSVDITTNLAELEGDDGAQRSFESQIVLAQRVSRSFQIDGEKRLEPFLVITQSIDAVDGTDAGQGVESGLKLDQRAQFSLSASTALKRSEAAGENDVSGKVQLKVPFN